MHRNHLLYAIIVSIILFPWIPTPNGMPELRLEWLLLLLGLASLKVSNKNWQSKVVVLGVMVFGSYLLSIVYAMFFSNLTVIGRDFTVLMQPLLYGMFYLFCVSGSFSEDQYRKILSILLGASCVAAIIAIIQFFNPTPIANILLLFTGKERIDQYILLRATGTMGNPNDLGFLLNIGFALALFTLRHRIFPSVLAWMIVAALFFGVFATGSRTAFVCLGAILLVYYATESRRDFKQAFFTFALIGGVVVLFRYHLADFDIFINLLARISSFQSLEEDTAWMPRVYGAIHALPLIAESLFLGHGPAKEIFTVGANIDNEYILLLYRYGLVGTLATISFVVVCVLQIRRGVALSLPLLQSMRHCAWALLVAGMLFAYTAGLFMSFRLFGLLIIIFTISARIVPKSQRSVMLPAPHQTFLAS